MPNAMKSLRVMLGLAATLVSLSSAYAAELVGRPPYTGAPFGQQSDQSSGPAYTQSFVSPSGKVLEAIRWWGFHGANSGGASFDNFVVSLDGVVQAGALSVTSAFGDVDEYTLDIADVVLAASTLSISNDSGDVEWFWQSATASGNPDTPDATDVAFSLIGRDGTVSVSEPRGMALALCALAALGLVRRYV